MVNQLIKIMWMKAQIYNFLTYMLRRKNKNPLTNDYDVNFWKGPI
jgi:hypothetical protein